MGYVLNKIVGAPLDMLKEQLQQDAASHAKEGMYLEHVWTNADNPDEVYFLFRVDDLDHCKRLTESVYKEVRKENPDANLPEKIFLKEEN